MKSCALLLSLLLVLLGGPAWAEGELVTGPDRRHAIDLRIEELDAERAEISTRGPKTAVWIGLGTVVLGFVPLAVAFTDSNDGEYDYAREAGGTISGATLIGIGALTATVGGFIWGERVKKRNEIDAERKLLIEKRGGLTAALSRLELQSPHRNGTQFVTLGFQF